MKILSGKQLKKELKNWLSKNIPQVFTKKINKKNQSVFVLKILYK